MKKRLYVCFSMALSVAILLPQCLAAQITISSSDIQQPVGSWATWGTAVDSLFTVDLGTTGGPQSWDFTSYNTSEIEQDEVVEPGGTPFTSDFPTANHCTMITVDFSSEESYQYNRIVSYQLEILGAGFESPDTMFSQTYDPPLQVSLPIAMGSSWSWEQTFVDTIMGTPISNVSRSHWTVDAYGTMTVSGGTFDALRALHYDTSFVTVGEPPLQFSDTTSTIVYHWLAREVLDIVEVESVDNETNPDFTMAERVRVLTGHGLGIGDGGGDVKAPHAFELSQNTPNPFNPMTSITFTVSEDAVGATELSVFTLRGKKVRTILSESKAPGTYTVSWDGKNDRGETLPSGVFLYRLVSGGESVTRKMVMSK